jgi:pyruvate dehydrogenase E2 component (dihydrolipoamide acetyltransferase)
VSAIVASEIRMPRLSDSMEQGTILRWLKATGDSVRAGEPIVEIETDKATMEYQAEADGVLEIISAEGTTVVLGAPIARLLPEAHRPGAALVASSPSKLPRVLATPVARRVAAQLGIDLAVITPSGRRGQIVRADVEALAPEHVNGRHEAAPLHAGEPGAGARLQALSRVQQLIAQRMSQSRAVIPDFTLELDVEMGACMALRAELSEVCDPPPSVNDLIIKACALALREHPRANGAYRDGQLELHDQVNVGFAVAARDALVVPVVAAADRLPIGEIARSTRELTARARNGRSSPADLAGATFTVSNLGMFGIARFTAIINPPQAGILAVGCVEDRPVVRNGELRAATVMTATVAADHRILYGADAAAFLTAIRDRLQAPLSLIV